MSSSCKFFPGFGCVDLQFDIILSLSSKEGNRALARRGTRYNTRRCFEIGRELSVCL